MRKSVSFFAGRLKCCYATISKSKSLAYIANTRHRAMKHHIPYRGIYFVLTKLAFLSHLAIVIIANLPKACSAMHGNTCNCTNGQAATAVSCKNNGDNVCQSCDRYFYLDLSTCRKCDEPFQHIPRRRHLGTSPPKKPEGGGREIEPNGGQNGGQKENCPKNWCNCKNGIEAYGVECTTHKSRAPVAARPGLADSCTTSSSGGGRA